MEAMNFILEENDDLRKLKVVFKKIETKCLWKTNKGNKTYIKLVSIRTQIVKMKKNKANQISEHVTL